MAEISFKLAGTFVLAASATLIACTPAAQHEETMNNDERAELIAAARLAQNEQ